MYTQNLLNDTRNVTHLGSDVIVTRVVSKVHRYNFTGTICTQEFLKVMHGMSHQWCK